MSAPDPKHRPVPPDAGASRRGPLAALVGILVIGGLLFWALSAIRSHNAMQDCIDSGRRDCIELK